MDHHERVLDILEHGRLNWTLRKEELPQPLGAETTQRCALHRSDTGARSCTVGAHYQPMQNHAFVELVLTAGKQLGLDVCDAGALGAGRLVFIRLGLRNAPVMSGGASRSLTITLDHGAPGRIAMGTTITSLKHGSTFWRMDPQNRTRSTTYALPDGTRTLVAHLKEAIAFEQHVMRNLERMKQYEVDQVTTEKITMAMLLDIYRFQMDRGFPPTSRTGKRMMQIAQAITSEISLEGASLLALFKGVLRFSTLHAVPPHMQLAYAACGEGYRTNNKAYELIVEFMNRTGERNYRLS